MRRMRLGLALVAQTQALVDTEPVLFVDHDQIQLAVLHMILHQRMGTDDHAGAVCNALQVLPADRSRLLAGQKNGIDAERSEPVHEGAGMLFGQQLGRRHQRGLPAGADGG